MNYYKEINGKRVFFNGILKVNGKQIINPTEEQILADGWEVFVYTDPEKTVEDYRELKRSEIISYDKSEEVNEFYIQGYSVWLDKNTRVGLKLRFESELAMGKTETSLWYNNVQFPLSITNAINMLFALELYASTCYDNTQYHISEINKLSTIEEIEQYDYTTGYPEKLAFNQH